MTIYDDKTLARFWQKVDKRGPDECWDWTASTRSAGYGQLKLSKSRSNESAHIISYRIAKGCTNGLCVCHSCDRPVCCNTAHLFLGTHLDNSKDKIAKGRARTGDQTGERNARAVLTEKEVLCILRLVRTGLNNCEIGYLFGVTHSMISAIRLNKAWRHVPRTEG